MHASTMRSLSHTHSSGHTVFDFASVVYISVSIQKESVPWFMESILYYYDQAIHMESIRLYTSPGGQASELSCGGQHAVDV